MEQIITTPVNKNMSIKDLKIFLKYVKLYCEERKIKFAKDYIDLRLELRDRAIEHEIDHLLILKNNK